MWCQVCSTAQCLYAIFQMLSVLLRVHPSSPNDMHELQDASSDVLFSHHLLFLKVHSHPLWRLQV